jgi:hypothetical protein
VGFSVCFRFHSAKLRLASDAGREETDGFVMNVDAVRLKCSEAGGKECGMMDFVGELSGVFL